MGGLGKNILIELTNKLLYPNLPFPKLPTILCPFRLTPFIKSLYPSRTRKIGSFESRKEKRLATENGGHE